MKNTKKKIQSLKKMKREKNFIFTTYERLGEEEDGIVLQAELMRKQIKVVMMKSWSNVLVVGSSETGTTQDFINPTVRVLMRTKTKPSMIITDKNGRLYHDNAIAFAKSGYKILRIDFDKPLPNLDLCSIYEEPTVIFIRISLEIECEHSALFSSFITNIYNSLKDKIKLDFDNDKESYDLKRRIYFLLDEFGSLPTINDMVGKLKFCVRSRAIKFMLVVKCYEQLTIRYGEEDADAIKKLCWTRAYFDNSDFSVEMKQLGYGIERGKVLLSLPNTALYESRFTPAYQYNDIIESTK